MPEPPKQKKDWLVPIILGAASVFLILALITLVGKPFPDSPPAGGTPGQSAPVTSGAMPVPSMPIAPGGLLDSFRGKVEERDFESIRTCLEKAVAGNEDMVEYIAELKRLVMRDGYAREAIPLFQLLAGKGVPNPDIYSYMSAAFWEVKEQDKAVEAVRKGISLFPRDRELQSDLALYLLFKSGDPSRAMMERDECRAEAESIIRKMDAERLPTDDLKVLTSLHDGDFSKALKAIDALTQDSARYSKRGIVIEALAAGAIIHVLKGDGKGAAAKLDGADREVRTWDKASRDLFAPAIGNMELLRVVFLGKKPSAEYAARREEAMRRWEASNRLRLTDRLEAQGVNELLRAMAAGDLARQRESLERLLAVGRNYPGSCNFSLALTGPFFLSTYHLMLADVLAKSRDAKGAARHRKMGRSIFPMNPLATRGK
jgi:tetratricopeptide (TPR) repeat protein